MSGWVPVRPDDLPRPVAGGFREIDEDSGHLVRRRQRHGVLAGEGVRAHAGALAVARHLVEPGQLER